MRIAAPLALLATLVAPLTAPITAPLGLAADARAQGLERGAREGASRGEEMAGPLGAIVGGAIGAAVGTANGILGVDRRERFRIYALGERRPQAVDLGLVGAGDGEGDGFGKREVDPAVQRLEGASVELEGHHQDRARGPAAALGRARDLGDAGVGQQRDIEGRRRFGVALEPQAGADAVGHGDLRRGKRRRRPGAGAAGAQERQRVAANSSSCWAAMPQPS